MANKMHYCKLILLLSDFSNFIGKPSIRAIAEADDHEVVREVQVIIGIHSSVKVIPGPQNDLFLTWGPLHH